MYARYRLVYAAFPACNFAWTAAECASSMRTVIPGFAGYLFVFQKPKYWWVNHGQTHRQELEGEYLWSPKRNQNGAKNVSYDNMIHVMPGDVVLSFAEAAIRAIGVALGRAREAPRRTLLQDQPSCFTTT
jgi:hypothetical protein